MAALETLRALATQPNGVKESKLEIMFAEIPKIGEATDALCKFFLVYRQDGVVKMLSPFRFYFRGPTQNLVFHSESSTARNPAVEDIQCARPDATDSGLFSFSPARGDNF